MRLVAGKSRFLGCFWLFAFWFLDLFSSTVDQPVESQHQLFKGGIFLECGDRTTFGGEPYSTRVDSYGVNMIEEVFLWATREVRGLHHQTSGTYPRRSQAKTPGAIRGK